MDSIVEALKKIVSNDCLADVVASQCQLILKEGGIAARGRMDTVTLTDIQSPFHAVLADKAKPTLCPLLNSGDYQKAADAIIFHQHNNNHFILICEMKSGTTRGAEKQFKNSTAIAHFLNKLCELHEKCIQPKWRIRYALIMPRGRSLKKAKTRRDKLISGVRPDRPKEIAVKNRESVPIRRLCEPLDA